MAIRMVRTGDGQSADSQVAGQFGNLAVREVEAIAGHIPGKPAHRHQDQGHHDLHALQEWRILLPMGVRVAHHYYCVLFGLNTQRIRNPRAPQNTNPHERPK